MSVLTPNLTLWTTNSITDCVLRDIEDSASRKRRLHLIHLLDDKFSTTDIDEWRVKISHVVELRPLICINAICDPSSITTAPSVVLN